MSQDLTWALDYARDYRQDNQARDAMRLLADAVLELRGETRALRELVDDARPVQARSAS